MTSSTHVLPTVNFNELNAGIRVFTRLFGLETDQTQAKYAASESDVTQALESVRQLMRETERFVGKQKHVGKQFDFVEDVKLDMIELLLLGETQVLTAVKRKRNLPLYHLIINPTVELFRQFDHLSAVQHVDVIIDHIIETSFIEENYGEYDDGLIAQAQVRQIIRDREEQSKTDALLKKKQSRKTAKQLEQDVVESLSLCTNEG